MAKQIIKREINGVEKLLVVEIVEELDVSCIHKDIEKITLDKEKLLIQVDAISKEIKKCNDKIEVLQNYLNGKLPIEEKTIEKPNQKIENVEPIVYENNEIEESIKNVEDVVELEVEEKQIVENVEPQVAQQLEMPKIETRPIENPRRLRSFGRR